MLGMVVDETQFDSFWERNKQIDGFVPFVRAIVPEPNDENIVNAFGPGIFRILHFVGSENENGEKNFDIWIRSFGFNPSDLPGFV